MKRRFTILGAAFVLFAFLAIPMGMRGQASVGTTMWAEDFSSYVADDVPSGDVTSQTGTTVYNNGTVTYSVTNGGGTTKIYDANLAGGEAPELLVAKGGGSWTIAGIPTGNAVELTLTYKTNNNNSAISSTTEGVTVTEGTSKASTKTYTIGTGGASNITLVVTNTASGNTRVDDFSVVVKTSEGGTPTPTTYTVTYDCNGGTSGCPANVTGIEAGTTITLANAPTKDGFDFTGWSDGTNTYDAGDAYLVNGNITFTAQWTEQSSGDVQWVLTNLADLTTNDVFVIVSTKDTVNYAMSNDKGASAAPTAVSVDVANNQITSTVASTIQWTGITGNATDGYTIYSNADNAKYLYCIGQNNGVRVGTGDDNTFIIKDNYIYNNVQRRYLGVYNNADWRCYTTIHANIQGQTFAFYKKVTGGVIPPSISAENVNIEYNALAGSIAYTVNNGVTGGTMSAAVTDGDWLTLGSGTTSPISFTCTANASGIERTATVTLTYMYNRATATANVTVTQAGNPNATMTIAEVRAQATGSVVTTGTVTSCVGTTGYIQDATAAICVFGTSLTVGDVIRVTGTLSTYHGLLEITSPEVTVLSSGETVAPEVMTIAEINTSTNQGWYIRIENATVTAISGQNTTIAQGDNTIVVRGISSNVTYAMNDILTLDGNIGCYDVAQIANPQNVTVQQNTEPIITIADAVVNVPAEGAEGTLTVLYDNIDEIVANVYFCNAEGEVASYDWIYAEIDDDDNLYYNVYANTGEARTAYMKVRVGNVYSNLITINQAVAEYATLPFEFDGGRADIENTAGLTGYNLGSDYSSSPKLKFNNANETISTLILKFNEVPGILTYDIKGNTFSGGTFKVQTSEDGETYTDLETYTEFGANGNSAFNESFDNLGENVRYIKWIYTEKVNGNVGIGNIHLYELGGGPVTEYDLTVEPFENLEIFTFVGGDENNPFEGAGTIQVTVGDQVMLSIMANEGYVIQSLMVDGVEHVNDITDDETYTFTMPDHNVTISATAVEDVPPTPFEPVTYTLATTIESGKTYIIVGSKTIDEETHYYAMGAQRDNNRAGVAISVDGTTATVETADVHEVVITALEEEGFYSIYDGGYLYAAGSNKNWLRTQDSLDVNAQWSISIDTVSHIVADSSANRNVMQFNYNSGAPIFSCYGSASQSPVYLYVKNETPSVVTQTIELAAGANWISTNVEINLDDLKTALRAALPTANAIKITAQRDGTSTWNGRMWIGGLRTLDVALMYKITVPEACEIALEGMPVDPADHPVTIVPGANWIGYQLQEGSTVTNIFAGFPANDDIIKSQSNGQAKWTGRMWMGTLKNLEPGKGYIYNSKRTSSETFTFQ